MAADTSPEPGSALDPPPRRAWTRPGSIHSPEDDDGMLPFDDLHFHRYCAVWPFLPDDDPALEPDGEGPTDDGEPSIRYLSGLARVGLRHTPLIVWFVTIVFFASAEVVGGVRGISVLLPAMNPTMIAGIVLVGAVYLVIVGLVVAVGILDFRELYKATVVYGLMLLLGTGTVASIGLVLLDHSLPAERNVVFTSGYLLMLLLGGLLVYDGMLRTEHMFENLQVTRIVDEDDRYGAFKEQLAADLEHVLLEKQWTVAGRPIRLRVPTAYVFSVLLVSQWAIAWWIGVGPQNLDFPVTLWGNVLLDLFIVVVCFQFFVLINRFYRLINDDVHGDGGSALTYKPFHPDGYGGYRDFGKFATRVNMLLILGGFYLLYRLVVQGARVSPGEMAPGFDPLVGSLIWTASFIGPMLVYAVAAGGWLYYSFWQLHLRMLRERENRYATVTSSFDEYSDWQIRSEGPAWPTDFNQLISLVSGTFAPLVFLIVELL